MNTPPPPSPIIQNNFINIKCVCSFETNLLENNVYLGNSSDESIPILEVCIEITLINYTARLGLDSR